MSFCSTSPDWVPQVDWDRTRCRGHRGWQSWQRSDGRTWVSLCRQPWSSRKRATPGRSARRERCSSAGGSRTGIVAEAEEGSPSSRDPRRPAEQGDTGGCQLPVLRSSAVPAVTSGPTSCTGWSELSPHTEPLSPRSSLPLVSSQTALCASPISHLILPAAKPTLHCPEFSFNL